MLNDIVEELYMMDIHDDDHVYQCTKKAINEIKQLRAREARLRDALQGVIRIADRDCPEFRAARAALATQDHRHD